jgi:ATP-dependent DNA ligase
MFHPVFQFANVGFCSMPLQIGLCFAVFLYAFDILELDGADLRRAPVEERKRTLDERLLRKARTGLRRAHRRKLGLEGIVSKRIGSNYRSGRPDWLKSKIRGHQRSGGRPKRIGDD